MGMKDGHLDNPDLAKEKEKNEIFLTITDFVTNTSHLI